MHHLALPALPGNRSLLTARGAAARWTAGGWTLASTRHTGVSLILKLLVIEHITSCPFAKHFHKLDIKWSGQPQLFSTETLGFPSLPGI